MKKKRKYIYLEKCLIIRILQIYIFSFYDFLFFISLSMVIDMVSVSEHVVRGTPCIICHLSGVGVSHKEYASAIRKKNGVHAIARCNTTVIMDDLTCYHIIKRRHINLSPFNPFTLLTRIGTQHQKNH